jgi:hypothetical protein
MQLRREGYTFSFSCSVHFFLERVGRREYPYHGEFLFVFYVPVLDSTLFYSRCHMQLRREGYTLSFSCSVHFFLERVRRRGYPYRGEFPFIPHVPILGSSLFYSRFDMQSRREGYALSFFHSEPFGSSSTSMDMAKSLNPHHK